MKAKIERINEARQAVQDVEVRIEWYKKTFGKDEAVTELVNELKEAQVELSRVENEDSASIAADLAAKIEQKEKEISESGVFRIRGLQLELEGLKARYAVALEDVKAESASVTYSTFESVDVAYLPEIEKMIAKINRKAGKAKDLNGEFVTLNISNSRTVQHNENKGSCAVVADLSLEFGNASTLVLNGWEMLGMIEKGEGSVNFVHGFSPDSGIDWVKYTHDHKPACDACGSKRRRLKSYIVRNGDEVLEVGSKCLKMYTSGYNVPAMIKSIMQVNDHIVGCQMFGPKYDAIDTEYFLALSFEAVSRYGWSSRSKPDGEPTADRALDAILSNGGTLRNTDDKWGTDYEVREVNAKRAQSALAWLAEVDPKESSYMHNIKELGSAPTFPQKMAGYVASIAIAYEKAQTKNQEAKEEVKESSHVGTVKKRQMFHNLELVGCHTSEGYYGPTYIHRFKDVDGNVLTWFSSSQDLGFEIEFYELERSNVRFTGKATVKKHDEYNGVKQTVITRAKFDMYVDGKKFDA